MPADFGGAKLILFIGPKIVVIERDHTDGIPWPGYLDLPGGGREGNESAEACVLREAAEEIGLQLYPRDLVWCAQLNRGVFFAARLEAHRELDIVFGSEGVGWALMTPQDYATHPKAIPHFARMIRTYLATRA